MKALFLLRGLPGSGKTTAATLLIGTVLSADQYFVNNQGIYKFDATSIRDAHRQCQKNTETAMRLGIEKIAVANTFTQEWEMQRYFELAEQYGYAVFSLIVENRHGGSNQHNVPAECVEAMRDRFEISL